MENLREIISAIPGVKNVRTYIQSGNILLDAAEKNESKFLKKIEKQLLTSLGFEVEAFIRTKEEIAAVIKNNPFKNIELSKALKLYTHFFARAPSKEGIKLIESFSNDLEKFKFKGRELYVLVRKDTTEKLKYSNMLIEKKLGVLATGRDWNTVNKVMDL